MPTYIRVKDLPNAATSPAADDFVLLSGTANGARKISRSDFIAAIASQIVAAPSTYKIATLDGADKLTSSQDPSQSVSYLGGHDMVANSPALADGSGTAGDTYYVTNPGTRNYGSGNITAQEGDALVYSGSVWQLVEGIANILDGISTASTARTTLSVNSTDEDAQANALKVTSPAMYFNGTSSVVTVADDDRFSFTDGTDDLPFTISGFIKMTDATNFTVASKYASGSVSEWFLAVSSSDNLRLFLNTSSGNNISVSSDTALTSYEGDWIHVAATYAGAGPNSDTAFSAANATLYVNGALVPSSKLETGTYAGMSNTTQPVWIGKFGTSYSKGSIRDCKIFNRSLTASEVAELARGNDLGFSEEWGGAHGAVYTSDFSAGADGWAASNGTAAGNIDSIGGRNDNLRLTVNTSNSTHFLSLTPPLAVGKRYRVTLDYYIPSGQSNVDGLTIGTDVTAANFIEITSGTTDSWTRVDTEAVANGTGLRVFATDAGVRTFQDAGGDDVLYIRNVTITEIGTLADFRSERYDTSTNKLYDLSDNAFVGTGTSVSLTGMEQPVYETGTWTPTITFGSGSTGITYGAQEGYYTRIGDVVHLEGNITLTATGTDTGTAKIEGLPFTARNTTDSGSTLVMGRASNMASLTSAFNGLINNNTTNATLYDWGAAGSTGLTEANFTATTQIRFSGTYQIQ